MNTQLQTSVQTHRKTHPHMPSIVSVAWARSKVELQAFRRNWASMIFTLLFPAMMMVILGSILSGPIPGTDVDYKQVVMAGLIAAGIMSISFSGLAITMAMERGDGTLKRLASTPMSPASYFMGKAVLVMVTGALESLILVTFSVAFFGLSFPDSLNKWFVFAWVLVLGAIACTLMGIAYSTLIPNPRAASAFVTPPFLVLQFASGIFFPIDQLPRWMATFASFFPLKWMAQGMRYVFLPDSFKSQELAGSWELGKVALVLTAWSLIGLLVIVRTFRWKDVRRL